MVFRLFPNDCWVLIPNTTKTKLYVLSTFRSSLEFKIDAIRTGKIVCIIAGGALLWGAY